MRRAVACASCGALLALSWTPAARAAEFHVSPTGSPSGDGSSARPWDLATALGQPATVHAGDTLWLEGGTYRGTFASKLTGTASQPITVRSVVGQWARIDLAASTALAWDLEGAWTTYRDFELFSSVTVATRPNTTIAGQHLTVLNMVMHDVGNTMLHGNGNAVISSIVYNNGGDGDTLAQTLYTQNEDASAPTRIVESIVFDSYAFGIHAYATKGWVSGLELTGNVWFNAGVAQTSGDRKDNCLIGTVTNPPLGIVLRENMGWAPTPDTRSVSLGRYNSINKDIALLDNYFVGNTDFTNPWESVTMTGNTFYGTITGAVVPSSYPSNTYLTSAPTTNKVFVRKHPSDAGRANIVVYNFSGADAVPVDVSAILTTGAHFEVRNGQNFLADPVLTGTYSGTPLVLPMSAGDDPAKPIGPGLIDATEKTGKRFNVFVLLGTAGPPPIADAGTDGGVDGGDAAEAGVAAAGDASQGGCHCVVGAPVRRRAGWPLLALPMLIGWRRRRRPRMP